MYHKTQKRSQTKDSVCISQFQRTQFGETLNQTETSGVINEQTRSKAEAERVQKDKGFLHLQ